jgi:hypothetical protein
MPLFDCILFAYPRMIVVDSAADPAPVPLIRESFGLGFIVVVHLYDRVFVWANPQTPSEVLRAYFGGDEVRTELPQIETLGNKKLHKVIGECYRLIGASLPTEVIPGGRSRDAVFADLLVDVSTEGGTDLNGFLRQFTSPYSTIQRRLFLSPVSRSGSAHFGRSRHRYDSQSGISGESVQSADARMPALSRLTPFCHTPDPPTRPKWAPDDTGLKNWTTD